MTEAIRQKRNELAADGSWSDGSAENQGRWDAVVGRDRTQDGLFVYGVISTRIYCRPGCGSRAPHRKNVRFFPDGTEARKYGFRACKRCLPDDTPDWASRTMFVSRMCRLIETSSRTPTLALLGKSIGYSPFHSHRMFLEVTGVTPRAYAVSVRTAALKTNLSATEKVTDAIHGDRAVSASQFYADMSRGLGMAPATFVKGGKGMTIHYATAASNIGRVLVGATDRGVCAILIGDDPEVLERDLHDRFPAAALIEAGTELATTITQVVSLIHEPETATNLPLDIRGTAFQCRVWHALREVRPGETIAYSQLAERIGNPSASRAVANACGENPLAVAVPCHRVVRSDGTFGGYRWGVERKKSLLDRERRNNSASVLSPRT